SLARAVQPQQCLLFGVLDRNKPHVRSADRLANGLGIRRIMFIGLHVRLDKLRRNELHRMPKRREPAGPEMRTATGLHSNQAGRQLGEKCYDLRALQLLAHPNLASRIDPVHLENSLCQIKPNLRSLHRGRSCWFKWSLNTSTLAHLMPRQAGASMPLPLVRLRYGLVTRRHPFDGVVGRLQNHGFPTDPATPATGLRLLPRWDCLPQNAPAFAGRTTAASGQPFRCIELPHLAGCCPSRCVSDAAAPTPNSYPYLPTFARP